MFGPWQHATQRLKEATDFFVRHRNARGRRKFAKAGHGLRLTSHRFQRERRPHWIIPTLSLLLPALAVNALAIWLFQRYDGQPFARLNGQAPLILLLVPIAVLFARASSATVGRRLRVIAIVAASLYPLRLLCYFFQRYIL